MLRGLRRVRGYVEATQLLGLLVADVDSVDARIRWTRAHELDQPVDRVGLALDRGFDRAVRHVANPARQVECAGAVRRLCPEEDALDVPVRPHVAPHEFRAKLVCAQAAGVEAMTIACISSIAFSLSGGLPADDSSGKPKAQARRGRLPL